MSGGNTGIKTCWDWWACSLEYWECLPPSVCTITTESMLEIYSPLWSMARIFGPISEPWSSENWVGELFASLHPMLVLPHCCANLIARMLKNGGAYPAPMEGAGEALYVGKILAARFQWF